MLSVIAEDKEMTILFWVGIYILIGWGLGLIIYHNSQSEEVLLHPTATMVWSMLLWPVYITAFLFGLITGTFRKLTNKNKDDG